MRVLISIQNLHGHPIGEHWVCLASQQYLPPQHCVEVGAQDNHLHHLLVLNGPWCQDPYRSGSWQGCLLVLSFYWQNMCSKLRQWHQLHWYCTLLTQMITCWTGVEKAMTVAPNMRVRMTRQLSSSWRHLEPVQLWIWPQVWYYTMSCSEFASGHRGHKYS